MKITSIELNVTSVRGYSQLVVYEEGKKYPVISSQIRTDLAEYLAQLMVKDINDPSILKRMES